MVQVTLEFASHYEAAQFMLAQSQLSEAKTCALDFSNTLRSRIKYGEHSGETIEVLEMVREDLYALCRVLVDDDA